MPIPPRRPNSNHMRKICPEKTDVATATALRILPMIPTGRQPNLLQSAEAMGAVFHKRKRKIVQR